MWARQIQALDTWWLVNDMSFKLDFAIFVFVILAAIYIVIRMLIGDCKGTHEIKFDKED